MATPLSEKSVAANEVKKPAPTLLAVIQTEPTTSQILNEPPRDDFGSSPATGTPSASSQMNEDTNKKDSTSTLKIKSPNGKTNGSGEEKAYLKDKYGDQHLDKLSKEMLKVQQPQL